jgi:hypothetical protein
MAYALPVFNLVANIWHAPNVPPSAPDLQSPCNLAYGRRVTASWPDPALSTGFGADMFLLLPPGTDIRDAKATTGADVVEVGAGTGRIYAVAFVDDSGCGFPNEHRVALLEGVAPWPTPLPQPGVNNTPPAAYGLFSGQDVGPSLSFTINVTLPPGLTYLAVYSQCPIGASRSVVSALNGTLALSKQVFTGTVGGLAPILHTYVWTSTGGADTITITYSIAGSTIASIQHVTGTSVDNATVAANNSNPVANPAAGTQAHVPESLVVAIASENPPGSPLWPFPLAAPAFGHESIVDTFGTNYVLDVGVGTLNLTSLYNLIVYYPPFTFFHWGDTLHEFNP